MIRLKKKKNAFGVIASLSLMGLASLSERGYAEDALPTAEEIIAHCNYKDVGDDQRTKMTIINRNKDGQEKKSVYRRFLRNYKGQKGVVEKMLLFAEFPPDVKGLAFMRWEYTPESGKPVDQWLYSPSLRNVRRVSVRDPGESFLGSTLALGDIGVHAIDQDNHRLLGVEARPGGPVYVVESTPKKESALYSKTVSSFANTGSWDNCVKVAVTYYDKKGLKLKEQTIDWQKLDEAWIWKQVDVTNVQTKQTSTFLIHDIEVNVGIKDKAFTERTLRRGF